MKKLYDLFSECLNIPYTTVGVSASYALRREGNALFIFFEGSNGANDWKNNLDFPAKVHPHADGDYYAHRGFLRTWQEIEPHLAPAIAEKSIRQMTVVGYSHGGAVATLCHEAIWRSRPDLRGSIEGYGFGAPRVFWGRRSPSLLQRWERYTVVRNENDLVTHLPPAISGYYHVGRLLSIGERGKYTAIEAHLSQNILTELSRYEKDL